MPAAWAPSTSTATPAILQRGHQRRRVAAAGRWDGDLVDAPRAGCGRPRLREDRLGRLVSVARERHVRDVDPGSGAAAAKRCSRDPDGAVAWSVTSTLVADRERERRPARCSTAVVALCTNASAATGRPRGTGPTSAARLGQRRPAAPGSRKRTGLPSIRCPPGLLLLQDRRGDRAVGPVVEMGDGGLQRPQRPDLGPVLAPQRVGVAPESAATRARRAPAPYVRDWTGREPSTSRACRAETRRRRVAAGVRRETAGSPPSRDISLSRSVAARRRVLPAVRALLPDRPGAVLAWSSPGRGRPGAVAGPPRTRAGPPYHPSRLSHLADARQVVVVTSAGWSTSYATLRAYRKGAGGRWRLSSSAPMRARLGLQRVRRWRRIAGRTPGRQPAGDVPDPARLRFLPRPGHGASLPAVRPQRLVAL